MYEESGEAQHMWGMRESLNVNDKDFSLRSNDDAGDLMPQGSSTQKDGRSRLCLWGCGGITDAVRGL